MANVNKEGITCGIWMTSSKTQIHLAEKREKWLGIGNHDMISQIQNPTARKLKKNITFFLNIHKVTYMYGFPSA